MMVGTPKEIVGELLLCGLSETRYVDPLWIRTADDVMYDAVFACRIETLQDNEQRTLVFGVEFVLQLCEACGVACKLSRAALVALVLTFVGWINVAKSKFGTRLHDELLTKIHDALPFFTCVFATSIKVSLSILNSLVQTPDVSILQMTASQ